MPGSERVESLLSKLSLEEKAALCSGSSMWYSTPVPRLGIPRLKVSDGPIGVRGGHLGSGVSAACFPNASALGATWNPLLVKKMGAALGQEARTKSVHVILGPTVNLHRSPLGGRHFEAYSEDPELSARLCVAFVEGVQSQGVGACVKHFVANDSEFERHSISSDVDERALRELYLRPFEAAVKEAQPWALMSAYNRINGTYASEHRALLVETLKQEWGFQGFVVSDWFGTNDTLGAAQGGLDLEMPGPARYFGPPLARAVKEGVLPEALLDDKVRRILRVLEKAGAFEAGEEPPERAVDRPEHRALARRLAQEAAVLLRNEEQLLPLRREGLGRLAVVGPNARVTSIQGGGSARVLPHYESHALDAIRQAAGTGVEIGYEAGCTSHKRLPLVDPARLSAPGEKARRGFSLRFFDNLELAGEAVRERHTRSAEQTWFGAFDSAVDHTRFSAELCARFTPEESGEHRFGLTCAGKARLFVDGELLIDNWTQQVRGDSFFGTGTREELATCTLEIGQAVELRIEYTLEGALAMGGLRLGHLPPFPEDALERAVAAARGADAAVVVVGQNADWETEGNDKADLRLPGRQDELVEAVAAANPNTVVVVNAGAPCEMPWASRVASILWVWYGGQEAGHAIADLLFGDASPSGRLPTTFPMRLEDNPAHTDDPLTYPGEAGHVAYREGVFLGYRHYDRAGLAPRFPFGHGLGYTRFDYGALQLVTQSLRNGQDLLLSVELRNAGERTGQEVVQCYLRDLESSLPRPPQELAAFAKVSLDAGRTERVQLRIPARAFCFWHPAERRFLAEPGHFEVRVGASSRDIRCTAELELVDGDE